MSMLQKFENTRTISGSSLGIVWMENASVRPDSDLKTFIEELDKLMRNWLLELGF